MKKDSSLTKKASSSPLQNGQKNKRKPAQTVGFRLEEPYLLKLEAIAGKRGNSTTKQAREMLMSLLDGDDAELMAMRLQVETLTRKFDNFAAGMVEVMEAVLVMSGGKSEKVRPWIEERLRKRVVN